MILFNFNLIQSIFEGYSRDINQLSTLIKISKQNVIHMYNNDSINSRPFLFSIFTAKNETIVKKISKISTQDKLISCNFIIKFINKYWQETIFLSESNSLSDFYMNKLKSDGIGITTNEYKNFLLEFSKALINGRIRACISDSKIQLENNNNMTYIRYIWRKGLNFSLPQKIIYPFLYFKNNKFPNKLQNIWVKKLQQNEFPVFTIINGFNQIIVAESSPDTTFNKNLVDLLYKWYSKYFLVEQYNNILHEGLFFINPKDALEYQNYIQHKYKNSSLQNHVKSFASKLDVYYNLVRSYNSNIQFRLIPDLKEVGELIYRYRYYKHITFHKQQKYGKDYFQGQPIYLIQPILVSSKKTKENHLVNYFYNIKKNNSTKQYEAIFMNYKTAMLAWKKFRSYTSNYNLPVKPKLTVYNLEDFIKICENNNKIIEKNIIFVPSEDSYLFIKNKRQLDAQSNIMQLLSNKFLYMQIISKRIIWSLTSRQPISW
uniref:Ycf80 n=1 Tax=Inkyuleea mariana TaxID=123988 RepID=A0A4D6X2V1_9FLOR|nr:hypothetical protein [Inkyuleea mariana]